MNTPSIRRAGYPDLAPLVTAFGDRAFFSERLRRQKTGRGALFIAWQDDQAVGTVYLWQEPAEEEVIRWNLPGVPVLTHLEVRTEYRNHGVGTELVGAVEDYLRNRGYRQVGLAVRTDNTNAIRLYERIGYRQWNHGIVECRKDPDLYADHPDEPEKCYVMTKLLATPGKAGQGQPTGLSATFTSHSDRASASFARLG